MVVVLLILSGLVVGLVRVGHPEWWRLRAVRRTLLALPVIGLVAVAAWVIPIAMGSRPAAAPGAFVAALVFVTLAFLVLSLPASGVVGLAIRIGAHLHERLQRRRVRRAPAPASAPTDGLEPRRIRRRDLLLHATAAIPGAALAAAGAGVVGAFRDPHLAPIEVAVPGLPAAVDGLRILQLTDIHLGTFVDLGELESVLEHCERARPDLVLITGDACDDMRSLETQVRLIQSLRPRLGAFASLGNHEYYRGVPDFTRAYERAGIPLLVSEGLRVPVGDASIWVAGADDPAVMGRPIHEFLEESIDAALRDRHTDEPVVLMSHRPDGFDAAATRGVTLTLSGHTHGGQIGHGRRSVFEPLFPHWYLRGRYDRDGSTLFTSSGFGHWFPFRLDCPAEVPLVTLVRT